MSTNNNAAKAEKSKIIQAETLKASRMAILNEKTNFSVKEAYKACRTNFMFALSNIPDKCKKIVFTSQGPGEGKTTTSINIAIAFAQTGAKVVIIDADLRRPHVHKYLELDNEIGLTSVLGGFNTLDEAIKKHELGIDCISCGHIPPNPSELLASDKMAALVEELTKKYDYIILDTPPINVVSDAIAMSTKMDAGVALVVRQKYTTHDAIKKSKATLEFANAKLIGFVLNDVTNESFTYRSRYGRYRSYRNYKKYVKYDSKYGYKYY